MSATFNMFYATCNMTCSPYVSSVVFMPPLKNKLS